MGKGDPFIGFKEIHHFGKFMDPFQTPNTKGLTELLHDIAMIPEESNCSLELIVNLSSLSLAFD